MDRWSDYGGADINFHSYLWNFTIDYRRPTSSHRGSVGANFSGVYIHVPLCEGSVGSRTRALFGLGGVVCLSLTLIVKGTV